MKKEQRYIFVGGCGRSGTTLVQKILTSHSLISGAEEFGYTSEIIGIYKDMKLKLATGFLDSFVEDELSLKSNFIDFYEAFFKKVDGDALYVSEKTPSNIKVLPELLELFENAVFLNVVRDGRDVVASHLAVKKRYKSYGRFAGFGLSSICKLWNDSIDKYLLFSVDPRVYNISFEKLLCEPETTLKGLFHRLNLDLEIDLLAPERIENLNKAHINDIWYTKQMFGKGFDQSSIGKWKGLGPIKRIWVNIALAENLKVLGYGVSKPYLIADKFLSYFRPARYRDSLAHKLYVKLRLFFS
ncbi:MAG: sulfotransferase [Flavobacteriales bacterium]|nr:sulfotransferase [Flavobacteriales bacterium]